MFARLPLAECAAQSQTYRPSYAAPSWPGMFPGIFVFLFASPESAHLEVKFWCVSPPNFTLACDVFGEIHEVLAKTRLHAGQIDGSWLQPGLSIGHRIAVHACTYALLQLIKLQSETVKKERNWTR